MVAEVACDLPNAFSPLTESRVFELLSRQKKMQPLSINVRRGGLIAKAAIPAAIGYDTWRSVQSCRSSML